MANSSDPVRRRRSASDLLSLLGTATAPLRQSLAVSLSALGDNAQAAFASHFDSGYDPNASNEHGRRGEGGIAVRNLCVRYGERYAFEGLTGEFPPASLTAVIGPNGAGKSSFKNACRVLRRRDRHADRNVAAAPCL
jgi:ABC-type multidrug transport system fused ATPase/permease subunit